MTNLLYIQLFADLRELACLGALEVMMYKKRGTKSPSSLIDIKKVSIKWNTLYSIIDVFTPVGDSHMQQIGLLIEDFELDP